jgi:hypothetical protein
MRLTLIRIGSKNPFNADGMQRAISNTLRATAEDAQVDFQRTVATFSKKPTFTVRRDGDFSWTVSTDNQIYFWLTYGTRPHIIRPVNATRLAFAANYQRKTIPNVIASRPGGASGPTVYATEVMHPGTEATNHDMAIARRYNRKLPEKLRRALSVF